jgi:hypothetical protein
MEDIEKDIKNLICELRDLMDKGEIIAIIYNPQRQEGMQERDCSFLSILFENVKYTYPLILLSGLGGDFSTGLIFPTLINKKLEKYRVFIPRVCSSALCYTILKARELFIGENTCITQIDPKFEYHGEWVRAIEYLHSANEDLRDKSREVFDVAQKYVKKLIEPPCIFKYRDMAPQEFQHVELIVTGFMNKEEHDKKITVKELEQLEANITQVNNSDIDAIANKLIMLCQDYTLEQNARVIFVSSVPIILEKGEEGTFIAPLD